MRIICTIPNVPLVINNYQFEAVDGGVLSPDLPEEVAISLATIPGYKIFVEQAPEVAPDPEPATEPELPTKPRRGRPPKAATEDAPPAGS